MARTMLPALAAACLALFLISAQAFTESQDDDMPVLAGRVLLQKGTMVKAMGHGVGDNPTSSAVADAGPNARTIVDIDRQNKHNSLSLQIVKSPDGYGSASATGSGSKIGMASGSSRTNVVGPDGTKGTADAGVRSKGIKDGYASADVGTNVATGRKLKALV